MNKKILAVRAEGVPLEVVIVGAGTIGTELIRQIQLINASLEEGTSLFKIPALLRSDRLVEANFETGVDLAALSWSTKNYATKKRDLFSGNVMVVDVTASEEFATECQGYSYVVAANKPGFATGLLQARPKVFNRCTVGAALPVLEIIEILGPSNVKKVEGTFSGSLGYLFHLMNNEGMAFDAAYAEVLEAGDYFEPIKEGETYPSDLKGEDVLNKAKIIARCLGVDIPSDFKPDNLSGRAIAVGPGCHLGYVAEISRESGVKVGLRTDIREGDSFYGLEGTDNKIVITMNDGKQVMIQGPGAGKEVTAAGVLVDVLEAQGLSLEDREKYLQPVLDDIKEKRISIGEVVIDGKRIPSEKLLLVSKDMTIAELMALAVPV
jgi:homoserine dehydrogenase